MYNISKYNLDLRSYGKLLSLFFKDLPKSFDTSLNGVIWRVFLLLLDQCALYKRLTWIRNYTINNSTFCTFCTFMLNDIKLWFIISLQLFLFLEFQSIELFVHYIYFWINNRILIVGQINKYLWPNKKKKKHWIIGLPDKIFLISILKSLGFFYIYF